MKRLGMGVATVLLVACSSGPRATGTTTVEGTDAAQAATAARELVKEVYGALARGDLDGLQSTLAPDAVVITPRAGEVFATRTDAVVELAKRLTRKKHKLRSNELAVVASPSGRAAWATDTVEIDGTPFRVTAVLAEQDEFWVVVALHLARPMSDGQARSKPPEPPSSPGGGNGTADVVKLFERGAEAPADLIGQFADRPESTFLGRGPKDKATRGKKAIDKHWKKVLKSQPKLVALTEPRAGLAPDGTLAWIAADVSYSAKGFEPLPSRLFLVYERSGSAWELVSLQQASVTP